MIEPMEQTTGKSSLLETLQESRSFKRNPIKWSIFYGSAIATCIMFFILCGLSIWTLQVGHEITNIVTKSTEILNDVEEMLPWLQAICKHENFTKRYRDICS